MERTDPKTLVNSLVVDAKALVNDNVALAKAEVTPMAKNAGIGGGMFGAAGYLALNALSLLFMAGGFAFGLLLAHAAGWGAIASIALGFVIMAVILLVLAGILAMIGKGKISKVGAPKQTIAEAKTSVDTLKRSLKRGVAQVNADDKDMKGVALAKREANQAEKQSQAATTSAYAGTTTTTAPVTTATTGLGTGAHEAPKA